MIALLAGLFFWMALVLLDVVSIGGSIMGVGQELTVGDGDRAAFFTGVLATVVATPCTAPFMGTAIGYALGQPAAVALAVFTSLGLGLAFPYVLVTFVPGHCVPSAASRRVDGDVEAAPRLSACSRPSCGSSGWRASRPGRKRSAPSSWGSC